VQLNLVGGGGRTEDREWGACAPPALKDRSRDPSCFQPAVRLPEPVKTRARSRRSSWLRCAEVFAPTPAAAGQPLTFTTSGGSSAARPSGLAFAVTPRRYAQPPRAPEALAKHLDSVSSPGWSGISMSPLSRSAAAFLIHAAALRAVPGEGKDRREVPPGVQPARHGSRSVPFSSPPAQERVLSGRGGIGAEMSVGDGTTGSHGNQIRQALPDMVQDLEH